MKPILIPPTHHFWSVMDQEYHLILSHLVEDPDYFEFYRSEAELGKFLILDNSAHELGRGQSIDVLLEQGWSIGAKELVLPDVLYDSTQTVESTREALEGIENFVYSWRPERVMIVPQGETLEDWMWCFRTMLDDYSRLVSRSRRWVPRLTVGISKDYNEYPGGLVEILETSVLPAQETIGYDIHLLGWPKPLWDLGSLSRLYGDRIRTTDSSRPFVYGIARIRLDTTVEPPPYPGRPEGFFKHRLRRSEFPAAEHNIKIYKALVSGDLP